MEKKEWRKGKEKEITMETDKEEVEEVEKRLKQNSEGRKSGRREGNGTKGKLSRLRKNG